MDAAYEQVVDFDRARAEATAQNRLGSRTIASAQQASNARIANVGKYQSCMVSKLRIMAGRACREPSAARGLPRARPRGGGGAREGGGSLEQCIGDDALGARIQLVCKSQSCMVSKLRMIWKQVEATKRDTEALVMLLEDQQQQRTAFETARERLQVRAYTM